MTCHGLGFDNDKRIPLLVHKYGGREVHSCFAFAVRGSPSFVPPVSRSCLAVCASRFAVRGSYFVLRGFAGRGPLALFALRSSYSVVRGSHFAVRTSRFLFHTSWFAVRGPLALHVSRSRFALRSSYSVVRGSHFAVRTSRCVLRGSRFALRGPLVLYIYRSRFVVRVSHFAVHI